MKVGEPIDGRAYVESPGIDPDSREAARPLTDHVMAVLTELSGQPYVDMYASEVKESSPPAADGRRAPSRLLADCQAISILDRWTVPELGR